MVPDWLLPLFRSGAVADIAIAVLVIETAILLAMRHRFGLAGASLLANAVSGIALILALRAALVAPDQPHWIAIWLLAGFAGHLADLRLRATRQPRKARGQEHGRP